MRWRGIFGATVGLLLIGAMGPAAATGQTNIPVAPVSPPQNLIGRPELLADPTGAAPTSRPTRLPDVAPDPPSPGLIVLSAEYKLLRTRRQHADYAIVDPNTDTVPEGPIQALEGVPSSATRVAIGYRPGGSLWEIGFGYTFFRSRDTEAVAGPAGGLLYATQTRPGLIEIADFASSTAHWSYDLYDIELGRNYIFDQSLTLRALVGVRVADIGFGSQVLYDGRDATLARVTSGFQFTGAGLIVGGETHWLLGRMLSVFGRARGGLLVGLNEARLRETNDDDAIVHAEMSQRTQQVAPVLEMGMGVSFQFRRFNLRGGYDIANWFQLMNIPDIGDDMHKGKVSPRQSNLGLDGFFVQLGIIF